MRRDLNGQAREMLAAAGVSRAEWIRNVWPTSSTWRGDVCGCSDDRCIGHHHEESEPCGCLPVLLEAYLARRAASS